MTDLTKLDAANKALQADKNAAKTTKAFAAETTSVLHQLATVPAPTPLQPGAWTPASGVPYVPLAPIVTAPAQATKVSVKNVNLPRLIQNVNVSGAPDFGLELIGWFKADGSRPDPSPAAFTVQDVIGLNIGNKPPTSNGSLEIGIQLGTQANAKRLRGDGSIAGIWTGGNAANMSVEEFLATGWGTALYIEHVSHDILFALGDIRGGVGHSCNVEPWYGGEGSYNLTWDTCSVYCPAGLDSAGRPLHGLFLDLGTYGCLIKNVLFYGPGDAIWLPPAVPGKPANVVDLASCVFLNMGQKVTQT